MIKDVAFLLKESKISEIYSRGQSNGFVIGKMLKEDIPISLPWQKLFNTHIGIFGNTGSGKSNTLAKLYTVLFEQKLESIGDKSKFVILDFNGEYTADQLAEANYKNTLQLNTQTEGQDKFPLNENEFWNSETLSILFQATANTQRPFLNRIISGRKKFIDNPDSLLNYIKTTFKAVFTAAAPKADTLDLLRSIVHILNNTELSSKLKEITWMGHPNNTFKSNGTYFNADGAGYTNVFQNTVDNITIDTLNPFDELVIRTNLQLIRDLIYGYVQFEHIQPLLKRIESSLNSLKKVVSIENNQTESKLLTVVSLRKSNQEIKKFCHFLSQSIFIINIKILLEIHPIRQCILLLMRLIIFCLNNLQERMKIGRITD